MATNEANKTPPMSADDATTVTAPMSSEMDKISQPLSITSTDSGQNIVNDDLKETNSAVETKNVTDKPIEQPEIEKNEELEKNVDQKPKPESSQDNNVANISPDDYAKYVTYNEKGVAIYTDPMTKCQYEFSTEQNEWIPLTDQNQSDKIVEDEKTNPFENEHYRWCHQTNQWLPKTTGQSGMENEFYKWDAQLNQWIPKDSTAGQDGKTYTDSDGTVFFWDDTKKAWFPKIDEEFMANYQLSYGFIDNVSKADDDKKVEEKLKVEPLSQNQENESDTKKMPNKRKQPEWFELSNESNTKVYVDNLPDDITEQEFIELMSKCGMILKDPQTGKYKVKLYAEPSGQLKGDGLCTYIRVESVHLALNLLDGSDYRGRKLKVQRAKFQMRGEYNPALKPKKKKADKEKLKKMQEKLLDWRPDKLRGERSKHERIVIIKNLFSPELFEEQVHLLIDYQKDLREECSKCGTVRKVVIYDRHTDGVAQINMSDPEEADLVVQMMNRRFFGKRQLIADIWDGQTRYKIEETGVEQDKRLSNWDEFLKDEESKEVTKNE